MRLAPVALFVFNRPKHTEKVLTALAACRGASKIKLYVFADGPSECAGRNEHERITEVRRIVRSFASSLKIEISEATINLGLRRSITGGVSQILTEFDRVIVLEDDIVISPGFLDFMNQCLADYADDEKVMQIAGSVYDAKFKEGLGNAFFGRVMQCHGWATWRRAWQHYNDDSLDHLTYFQSDPRRARDFDVDGSAYFLKQLQRNVTGELDTWAVRWYASWLRAGGVALFPKKSLVTNIGFDSSGANCGNGRSYLASSVESLEVQKLEVEEDQEARASIADFWRSYLERSKRRNHGGLIRSMARRALAPVVPIARKVARKTLATLFPDLKPLLQAQGRLSWSGVISSTKGCRIAETARLFDPTHLSWTIVGDYSYLGPNSWVSYTEIGKFCSIGPNFRAGWGIHPTDGISTSPSFYSSNPANDFRLTEVSKVIERKKITIGNDVFIGMNVTVLDGVTIGDGAVVGAGCVVSKNVPPYAIVVGCPMKVLRYRFHEETRAKLQGAEWWDWSGDNLPMVADRFSEVDEFVSVNIDQ